MLQLPLLSLSPTHAGTPSLFQQAHIFVGLSLFNWPWTRTRGTQNLYYVLVPQLGNKKISEDEWIPRQVSALFYPFEGTGLCPSCALLCKKGSKTGKWEGKLSLTTNCPCQEWLSGGTQRLRKWQSSKGDFPKVTKTCGTPCCSQAQQTAWSLISLSLSFLSCVSQEVGNPHLQGLAVPPALRT
jgi:hypothetical protein